MALRRYMTLRNRLSATLWGQTKRTKQSESDDITYRLQIKRGDFKVMHRSRVTWKYTSTGFTKDFPRGAKIKGLLIGSGKIVFMGFKTCEAGFAVVGVEGTYCHFGSLGGFWHMGG